MLACLQMFHFLLTILENDWNNNDNDYTFVKSILNWLLMGSSHDQEIASGQYKGYHYTSLVANMNIKRKWVFKLYITANVCHSISGSKLWPLNTNNSMYLLFISITRSAPNKGIHVIKWNTIVSLTFLLNYICHEFTCTHQYLMADGKTHDK